MTPRQTRSARPDRAALGMRWLVLLVILFGTLLSSVGGMSSHGIAAIAAAASDNDRYDRDYRYDRAGYEGRDGYGYRDNPRAAVEQCVRAAERFASQRYGRADVTDIRQIRETRNGLEVKGRIAVNTRGRDWRRGWRPARFHDRRRSDPYPGRGNHRA